MLHPLSSTCSLEQATVGAVQLGKAWLRNLIKNYRFFAAVELSNCLWR